MAHRWLDASIRLVVALWCEFGLSSATVLPDSTAPTDSQPPSLDGPVSPVSVLIFDVLQDREQRDDFHSFWTPRSFVASFVGENNALPGRVDEIRDGVALIETSVGRLAARVATAARDQLQPGADAILFIRPEAVDIDADGAPPEASIRTTVTGEEFEGPNVHLNLTHASGTELRASLVNKGTARAAQVGTELDVVFDPMKAVALPSGALSEEE